MNLVLKHNVFEFDEKFNLQIQGTVMGTKMAPAYANLFMGRLEACVCITKGEVKQRKGKIKRGEGKEIKKNLNTT